MFVNSTLPLGLRILIYERLRTIDLFFKVIRSEKQLIRFSYFKVVDMPLFIRIYFNF